MILLFCSDIQNFDQFIDKTQSLSTNGLILILALLLFASFILYTVIKNI